MRKNKKVFILQKLSIVFLTSNQKKKKDSCILFYYSLKFNNEEDTDHLKSSFRLFIMINTTNVVNIFYIDVK